MKCSSKIERAKELKSDEDVKIVKHSSELGVELPTLETTDSIDRQSSDSTSLAQNISITPTRCPKEKRISNIEYMGSLGKDMKDVSLNQGDVSNAFGSHSSSLVNSVERTTAPSSMMGSLSRYDSCYGSNLSPSTNFQTPCGRNPKKRNISNPCLGESFQNKENDKSNNSNFLGSKKDLVESTGQTSISGVSNSAIQPNQISGSVLLSAVLQVIASIQKLKSGEQLNGVGRGRMVTNTANINSANTVVSNVATVNNNSAAQILGSKLPGVHPTTAALALAYSLSVVASAKKTSGGAAINSDDIIQSINQIVPEKISGCNFAENADNTKITGELIQSIVSSLSSLISHSQGESRSTIQRRDTDYLVSPNKASEFNDISKLSKPGVDSKVSGPSYNLKLPPMDFIINEKSMCNNSRKVTSFQNVGKNDSFSPNKSTFLDMTNNNICNANNYKLHPYLDAESSSGINSGIENSFGQIEYTNRVSQINGVNHSKSVISNAESVQTEVNNSQQIRESNNPFSLILSEISRCSEKKIILESSNNCIWNDLSYNQVFDHVDFQAPFTRKHAYMRNELVLYNKPILEIDHGGDSFSMPSYVRIPSTNHLSSNNRSSYSHNYNLNHSNTYSGSKLHFISSSKYPPSNNYDLYSLYKYNPRIQSFCDDLLVNSGDRKNSQIFNSINYLMQIVGDGGMNNNNNK
ncbi:uncharacterized protein ELE39_000510 [Cryptosporidium sp. chipmunk genotype I]|uniref:uncharacterized protein n=1 Tax=Cryptosporidium sp. chipmunk genotype I TaxID=1280935 RepID=UPI00351A91D1|nr:hypothetical protein ELE39_000510 [Cryptosporidium sp. chipmunk genotype I]